MTPTATVVLATYLLQAAGNVVIAGVLLRFWRSYRRDHLRDWGFSWLALGGYHAFAGAALFTAGRLPPAHPVRLLSSAAALVLVYWHLAWLLQGTWAVATGGRVSRRLFHGALGGLALAALASTFATLDTSSEVRLFVRVGVPALAAALALGAAGYAVLRAARPSPGLGPRLLGGAFLLYGVDQGYSFVANLPFVRLPINLLAYTSLVDFLLQMGVGLGMTVWLLEDEQGRARGAARTLEQQHAFTATLLDTVGALVVVLDPQGRIVRWNRACERLTGYPAAEVAGRAFWEFLLPPTEGEGVRAIFASRLRPDRYPNLYENEWVTRDGRRRWIVWSNTALCGRRGEVEYVLATGIDITDRKRADEAVRESEVRLRLAVEAAELGTWEMDWATRKGVWSDRAKACFGLPPDAPLDVDVVLGRVHPDDRGRLQRAALEACDPADGKEYDLEYRAVWPDGSVRWLAAQGRAFFEGAGAARRCVRFVGVVGDVTERRRLEARLQQAQKLESLGVLAGGVAHDFNNLLTAMLGYASLARHELPAGSVGHGLLHEVEKAAERAADLARQMLAYSGKGKFVRGPVRLDGVAREMARLLETVVAKKAALTLELAPAPMEGDATQVRQILMNLITNAADAVGAGGAITLRTGTRHADAADLRSPYLHDDLPEGRYAFVEVADNGGGMTEDTLAKLFDPFFTTKFTGRGLGLAAVLGIVRGHRGTVKVASAPGAGTTFQLLFPYAEAAPAEAPKSPQEPCPWRGRGTVLVVEDEGNVRAFARRALEGAGFAVQEARDGHEGLEVFERHRDEVRAVLVDLTMPRLGGAEVVRRLRRREPSLPIVLMSGYTEEEVSAHVAGMGVGGFLMKPFRPEDLVALLRALLPP